MEAKKENIEDHETANVSSEGSQNDTNQKNETQETSSEVEKLKEELSQLKEEVENQKTLQLRTLADAENLRKRLVKDVENSRLFAMESFFKEILLVLDGFDKAFVDESSFPEAKSFNEGVSILSKQLLDILHKNGLEEIQSVGQKFDPNLHQAIKTVESEDVQEETVEAEYTKGYKMHDKLIRPSLVSVLVPTSSKS